MTMTAVRRLFRRATAFDFQAVLDINENVYEGYDHLPALYRRYVNHPKHYIFVCEVGGKVVALQAFFLLDNDTTIDGEWARCHPGFQDQGLWRDLHVYGRNYVAQRHPNLRWVTGTSVNRDVYQKYEKKGGIGIEWDVLEASTCHAEITSRLDDMSVTKTSRDQRVVLQNEDKEPTLLKLISDRRLFQNETVAVGWVHVKP